MAFTVLVADNDQTSLELISAVLTRDGFRVLSTPDGFDALSKCLELSPSLVVCSEKLSSMAVAELCRQIKAQSEGTRVVVLMGDGEGEGTSQKDLVCDAVLPRPFKYSSLKQQLESWGMAATPVPVPEISFSVPVPEFAVPDGLDLAPATLSVPEGAASASASMSLPIPVPGAPMAAPEVMAVPVIATPAPEPTPEPKPEPVVAKEAEVAPVELDIAAMEAASEPPAEIDLGSIEAAPPPAEMGLDFEATVETPALAAPPEGEVPAELEMAVNAAAAASVAGVEPAPVELSELARVEVSEPAEPAALELSVSAEPAALDLSEPATLELSVSAEPAALEMSEPASLELSAPAALELSEPAEPAALELSEPASLELSEPAALELWEPAALELSAPAAAAPKPASLAAPASPELSIDLEVPPPLELDLDSIAAPAAPVREEALELADVVDSRPSAAAPPMVVDSPPPAEAPATVVAAPGREVGVLPPSVPRYGDLGAVPLPRLVFELYCATFSGILRLARHGMRRAIYFWGGLPVRVDSDQASDSLGRLLLAHGRLTEPQLEQATALMQKNQSGEGEALVELSLVRRGELLEMMRELTEQRLSTSFGWRDGTYRIDTDQSFRDSTIMNEVHPLKAIFRGVREHYDLVSLLTYFANLRGKYAVATELFTVHYDTLGAFWRELDMVQLLDGQTSFEDALRSDDRRAMEIAQALYVLLVTDMVRATAKPGAAVSLPRQKQAPQKASQLVDYREMTRLCDEIAREYLRLKDGDIFEALRIDYETSPDQVDEAYKNVVRPFVSESLPPGLPEDAQRRAVEICETLGRARVVARDTSLKERYIAAQRQKFAAAEEAQKPKAAAGPSGPPELATLELDTGPSVGQEQRALAERAYGEAQKLLKEQPAAARQKLELAVRLNPNEPGYRTVLAQVLLLLAPRDSGVRKTAVDHLKEALKLDPSNVDANFELGRLLANFGKPDAAKTHLNRVLQRAPEHREARAILQKLEA